MFDAYNIVDEQDHQAAAVQLAGRLPVAIAAGESKSTTGKNQGRVVSAEVSWWTILDLNQ